MATIPTTALALTTETTKLTMSSIEIAGLTSKLHSHIIRDIKVQFAELYDLQKDDPNLSHQLKQYVVINYDNRGYVQSIELNKEQTLVLISGYSAKLRFAIIRRWQELEQSTATAAPSLTRKEVLLLALQAEERAEKAEANIKLLTHQGKLYTVTEIAKEIGLKSAQQLNAIMHNKKLQYKLNGTWVLRSEYADFGYVSIKQQEINGHIVYDRKFTGLGRDWLLREFNKC
jgi:phage antirepressor YoqD-like protein